MATQQIVLEPHEMAALLISKANMIANHVANYPLPNMDYDGLSKELMRMGELVLSLREKAAVLAATAEASDEARPS